MCVPSLWAAATKRCTLLPPPLPPGMHLQASALAREASTLPTAGTPPAAASAAATTHARSGTLAPLLALASSADARVLLRAAAAGSLFAGGSAPASGASGGGRGGASSAVSAAAAGASRASGLFTSLRGFPGNQGELDGARHALCAALGRLSDALTQVAKRLVALKVCACHDECGWLMPLPHHQPLPPTCVFLVLVPSSCQLSLFM